MCINDKVNWQKFKRGDSLAFLALYDQYFPLLFRYCKQITPATQLIEDVIHDLFVYLWIHKENLSNVQSVQAYLITSVRRRVLTEIKNQPSELPGSNSACIPFEIALNSAIESELKEKILELNEKQREVLFLKFYNDLSYQEIAEIMDIKVDAVYKIAKRSLGKLKKKLLLSRLVSGGIGISLLIVINLLFR